jgi:hypothetical protein
MNTIKNNSGICIRKAATGNILVFITLAILVCNRQPDMAGSATEGGNVTGCIIDSCGSKVHGVKVQLFPAKYDPIFDGELPNSLSDTTSEDGTYSFRHINKGSYNIIAVHLLDRTRAMASQIKVEENPATVLPLTLQKPGAVKFVLPERTAEKGYAMIPGSCFAVIFPAGNKEMLLDSVPVGMVPETHIVTSGDTLICKSIEVTSAKTTVIANLQWTYRRQLYLNTSASGADIQGNVLEFPVLVRLTSEVFDFSQAKMDGADIRFTSAEGKQLQYEIEQWDITRKKAQLWVRVDTVSGNNSTQFITMYWGMASATGLSNSTAVFDTAGGFQGVWHFSDLQGDSARDATSNKYYGTSSDGTRPQAADGVIGACNIFDGLKDYITMPNTANSKLNFSENSNFTICAWASLDTIDNSSQVIVSKGYEQYFLRLGFQQTHSPLWEFAHFNQATSWQSSYYPATSRQWSLLTGIRMGSQQFLYYNGVLVDSTSQLWPNPTAKRNTSNDLSIGRFLQEVTNPEYEGYCFFKGAIDEVRILSMAQNTDWIRLCYMNQRVDDRLVVFR